MGVSKNDLSNTSGVKSLLKYHKNHKKCHNFIDTPSDKCLCNHGIEDTNHFLFLCPFYAAQRSGMYVCLVLIVFIYVCLSCVNCFIYVCLSCVFIYVCLSCVNCIYICMFVLC